MEYYENETDFSELDDMAIDPDDGQLVELLPRGYKAVI